MPTGADLIARRLAAAGCRHAFGMPGGEVLAVMDALDANGIDFTLVKHENAGGYMAEGTWHATGAPAVLLATIGPGVANAVNAVANAQQDRVPLIFLTGCVDSAEAATYTHQVFDHQAVLAPITKASLKMADGAVDVLIDKAVAIAMEHPQGPVHVDIPIKLAEGEQPDRAYPIRAASAPAAPAPGRDLDRAREMLAAAERPVVVAGLEVLADGASEAVARFCRDHGVPILTTYKGKGILPEGDPMAMGGHGLSPKADKLIMPFLAQSDCVLCLGYDPIEMRVGWRDPWDPARAIEVVNSPNTHYMHHTAHSFVGHIGAGLAALAEGLAKKPRWIGGEPEALKTALAAAFAPEEGWGPARAMAAIREAAPRDTVSTVDSGAHRILLSEMWECPSPRTLLQSSALCTMGIALPLAIGHKLAQPETPVICFTGDAGLEMVMGDLATLRDLRLPVAVVVFVDRSLALIEMKQRATNRPNLGVDFPGTDFPALARALGGNAIVADTEQAARDAIKSAFAETDRFTLIAVPIDRRAYDGMI
ncbi:MAG: thiamine pyrophosphate-binding protein [Alphaproteobacteria bacterium]|nr:thiamine pyrophosphate-binding protein [Alphaproteobacteria bacterium]